MGGTIVDARVYCLQDVGSSGSLRENSDEQAYPTAGQSKNTGKAYPPAKECEFNQHVILLGGERKNNRQEGRFRKGHALQHSLN